MARNAHAFRGTMAVGRIVCGGIFATAIALAPVWVASAWAAPPVVRVDSAPRVPLPSEPAPETLPLARIVALAASLFVVAAVVALVMFVRRRERSAPRLARSKADSRRRTPAPPHGSPVLVGAGGGRPPPRA